MIARLITLSHLCRALTLFNQALLIAAISIVGVIFYARDHKEVARSLARNQVATVSEEDSPLFAEKGIGLGPLQLKRDGQRLPFLPLADQFFLLGENTRPDLLEGAPKLHLGLKNGQVVKAALKQKLYLLFTSSNQLSIVDYKTSLWIEPENSREGLVEVTLGLHLASDKEENGCEKKRFSLQKPPQELFKERAGADPSFTKALAVLEQGRWWGVDCLFESYGGKEYRHLKECQRIECLVNQMPSVLYVKKGDCMSFDGEKWSTYELKETTHQRPLARVKALSPRELKWEVWDEKGLKREIISHSKSKDRALTYRPETFFSRIRQRTATTISCRIDKKGFLLKEGDWLLKETSEWRVLKNFQEIRDVLTFKLLGDLFVFDGLEKSEGNLLFLGTFFNAARSEKQKVRFAIAHKKKVQHSPHVKNPTSPKIQSKTRQTSPEGHPKNHF